MRLALFQPDIPQNTGAAIRLCAGFNIPLEIIEPCGFPLDDAKLKRVAMDYDSKAAIIRRRSWEEFAAARQGRLILMTTKASLPYTDFEFRTGDVLLAGRESGGVPDFVHAAADARLVVPIATRSFNVIVASGIILAEGLRQTKGFPCSPS